MDLTPYLEAARAKGLVGTGVLFIDGHAVCVVRSFAYDSTSKFHEQTLGALGGSTYDRFVTDADVTIKITYGDVLGNVELFTWNSQTVPADGRLPIRSAAYHGFNGIVIESSKCHILPGNMTMSETGLATGTLEIRSAMGVLPTISDDSSGGVVLIPSGSTGTVTVDGTLVIDGTLP